MTDTSDSTTASVTYPGTPRSRSSRSSTHPPHAVYLAWTTPELISRWWAGNWGEVTSADTDLRPGGTCRYVTAGHDGTETVFEGEYRDAHVKSGVEDALLGAMEHLGQVVASQE